jgi:hypothetical protein
MLGLLGPKSAQIGAYRASFVYCEPRKKAFSTGSRGINEVVLGACPLYTAHQLLRLGLDLIEIGRESTVVEVHRFAFHILQDDSVVLISLVEG